jgi:hypothetical protein
LVQSALHVLAETELPSLKSTAKITKIDLHVLAPSLSISVTDLCALY